MKMKINKKDMMRIKLLQESEENIQKAIKKLRTHPVDGMPFMDCAVRQLEATIVLLRTQHLILSSI